MPYTVRLPRVWGRWIKRNVARDIRGGALRVNAEGKTLHQYDVRFAALYFGARRLEPLQSSERALNS
jgi:hypothetical protein